MSTPGATALRHPSGTRYPGSSLTGTATLVGFMLRRDRIKLSAWIIGLALFVLYIGAALPRLAPTREDLAAIVPVYTQPIGRMFTGPAFGMDAPTYERMFAAAYAPYIVLLTAVMNILLVTRHTRMEEQTGRAELLRANVIGRHSALTASLCVAGIANFLVAVVVCAMAIAQGYAVPGSALIGLAAGLTGMAFAAVSAVTVQLSEYSRSAAGLAMCVLGASFVLRALGDARAAGGSALSWSSPLGWPAQAAPYVHDRPAALLPLLGLTIAGVAGAYALQSRRDFGASMMAARTGSSRARPALGTPLGLAARLQRGALLGWGPAIVVLGCVDGAFTQAMLDAGADMPASLTELFGGRHLLDGYISFLAAFDTVLTAAYAVFAMQLLRGEESAGRADAVLATSVRRESWLGSHVVVVAGAAVLVTVVTAVATGMSAAAVTGDWSLVGRIVAAHACLIPATLLVVGMCAALFGSVPALMAPVSWLLTAIMAVIAFFATLLDLPGSLRGLSPLDHLGAYPLGPISVSSVVVVTLIAAALAAAGLWSFHARQVGVR